MKDAKKKNQIHGPDAHIDTNVYRQAYSKLAGNQSSLTLSLNVIIFKTESEKKKTSDLILLYKRPVYTHRRILAFTCGQRVFENGTTGRRGELHNPHKSKVAEISSR